VIALILLSSCASIDESKVSGKSSLHLFNDTLFSNYQIHTIESEEEVFELGKEAENYLRQDINQIQDSAKRMYALMNDLFLDHDLQLLYAPDANTIASETFRRKTANCLSMSIMAYSLAKEADFIVQFQEVVIPEFWTNREGASLLNGHINLRIFRKDNIKAQGKAFNGITLDFDPLTTRKQFKKIRLTKSQILAMYYNNKGADAFLKKEHAKAYAYFRASATLFPSFDSVWSNLGYLYKAAGDINMAMKAYQHALAINPDNNVGWGNFAILLQETGRKNEAEDILKRVEQKRQKNPYYHLMLGDVAFNQEKWDKSLAHYYKAIELGAKQHESYFGVAKSHFELGNTKRSRKYFKIAKRYSISKQDKDRYQGKLNLLSSL
jgi:tetratricopeptide (TPR) repeat protein